jgi:superfamily II DNA or RNA helicase
MSINQLSLANEQLHKIGEEMGLHWAQTGAHRAFMADIDAGNRKIYADMAMGSGKTALPLTHFEAIYRAGLDLPGVIFTDSKDNIANILEKEAPIWAPELYKSGRLSRFLPSQTGQQSQFQVASYAGGAQGLKSGSLERPVLGYVDETQAMLSKARQELFGGLGDGTQLIGTTATPAYSLRKSLDWAGFKLSYKLPFETAVARSILCSYRNVVLEVGHQDVSLDDIDVVRGDFDQDQLEKMMKHHSVMEMVNHHISTWRDPETGASYLHDRKGLHSCVTIPHAIWVSDYLNSKFQSQMPEGVKFCEPIWASSKFAGNKSDDERAELIGLHREGKIRYLSTERLLLTGHNDPTIDTIFNHRPMMSMVMVPQRGGRPMRFNHADPDKEAHIIDLVLPGNRHKQMLFSDYAGDTVGETLEKQERLAEARQERKKRKKRERDDTAKPISVPPYNVYYERSESRSFIVTRQQREAIAKSPWLAEAHPTLLNSLIKTNITSKADLVRRVKAFANQQGWEADISKSTRVGGELNEKTVLFALRGGFVDERRKENKAHYDAIRPKWQSAERKLKEAQASRDGAEIDKWTKRKDDLEADLAKPPRHSYEISEVVISAILGGHPSKRFGDIRGAELDKKDRTKLRKGFAKKVSVVRPQLRTLRSVAPVPSLYDPDYIFPNGTLETALTDHGEISQAEFYAEFREMLIETLETLTEHDLYKDNPIGSHAEAFSTDEIEQLDAIANDFGLYEMIVGDPDLQTLEMLSPDQVERILQYTLNSLLDISPEKEISLHKAHQRAKKIAMRNSEFDISPPEAFDGNHSSNPISTTSKEFILAATVGEFPSMCTIRNHSFDLEDQELADAMRQEKNVFLECALALVLKNKL